MPAYNCEAFVKQAIDSVLQQTYLNWELLVADDGSSDNTRAIIDSYSDARIIKTHNQVNEGNIRTRNRLFAAAKGEFLTVVDADDWIDNSKIDTQIKCMIQNPALGGIVSSFYKVTPEAIAAVVPVADSCFILQRRHVLEKKYMFFHPASLLVKREVYEKIGGLNVYFDRKFAEDIYWIFLIVESFKILYLPSPLYYYRQNPDSLTNNIDNLKRTVVTDLVGHLLKQRMASGEDWLSLGKTDKAREFEEKLLRSRRWMAEKSRAYAANRIRFSSYGEAWKLLRRSFYLNPFGIKNLQTLVYLLKDYIKFKLR